MLSHLFGAVLAVEAIEQTNVGTNWFGFIMFAIGALMMYGALVRIFYKELWLNVARHLEYRRLSNRAKLVLVFLSATILPSIMFCFALLAMKVGKILIECTWVDDFMDWLDKEETI